MSKNVAAKALSNPVNRLKIIKSKKKYSRKFKKALDESLKLEYDQKMRCDRC